MRRLYLILIPVLLCCTIAFVACSDDDDGVGSQIVEGDTSDASYQFVTDQVGNDIYGDFGIEVDLIFEMLANSAGYDLTASKGARIGQSLSSSSEDSITSIVVASWQFTETNWFIFEFSAEIREIEFDLGSEDTTLISVAGIDSLQLLLGGVSVDSANIGSDVDGFHNRLHATVMANGTDEDLSAAMNHAISLAGGYQGNDSLGAVNAAFDDTLDLSFTEDQNSCEVTITENSVITDLIVQIEGDEQGDCPLGGSASTTASLSILCTSQEGPALLDVEGSWTISAAINGNMRTITVMNGNTRWVVTEPNINCD
jgi:hypothetical protein